MRIAVISDIHSNIYALDKVIEDIKSKNVDMIICTGDLVGYGTRPNEVIHKMKEEKILTIMGNYDDAIGNLKIVCGCDYKDPKDADRVLAEFDEGVRNILRQDAYGKQDC